MKNNLQVISLISCGFENALVSSIMDFTDMIREVLIFSYSKKKRASIVRWRQCPATMFVFYTLFRQQLDLQRTMKSRALRETFFGVCHQFLCGERFYERTHPFYILFFRCHDHVESQVQRRVKIICNIAKVLGSFG